MKRTILAFLAALVLAGAAAPAQVVVRVGPHHRPARHCWYSHHHRHCR